ncbi:hypothetical protein SSX86_030256 [Deinandra increscens subsp. villosa]|uniref:DUF8039 domain-containing protein n=1 Tax=Deinandra increscens subsp. villosa TaxID=3103831 RepID=A0AAP0GKA4_9ASTR
MWYAKKHNEEFSSWMKTKVTQANVDKTVEKLGRGPDIQVTSYQGYDINGYTFYTKDQDAKSYTQVKGRSYQDDKEVNVNRTRQTVDTSLVVRGSSCVSDESSIQNTDIQNLCTCELLNPSDLALEQIIAKGQAYPTSDRSILHTNRIHEGFVKVQVDEVMFGCERMLVPMEARTVGIIYMEDTMNTFIQWPRNALKIVNDEAPHKSTSVSRKTQRYNPSSQIQISPQTRTYDVGTSTPVYIPQFDEPTAYQVQQQMASHFHIGPDDFVNSLIEMTGINQSEQPQMRLNLQPPSVKKTREKDQDKQATKIKNALKEIKKRPEAIQHMATQLNNYFCFVDNSPPHPVEFSTPHGMFRYV